MHQKILHFYVALILSFFSFQLKAQPATLLEKNIVFSQLPPALGLSQPTINCILQDNEGYLWIGTWSGLVRYDGYTTKTYHSNSQSPYSLKSNKIISLLQDQDGFIWIGTHKGGLFQFNPATEQFIQYKHDDQDPGSLSNDNVWALLEDQEGRIWVGTEQGLNLLNKRAKTFTRYFSQSQKLETLSHSFITDLHQSSSGKIWIATEYGFNQAIYSGDKISFRRYMNNASEQDHALHNYIYQIKDIVIAGKETLWLGTKKGLKEFSNGKLINHEVALKASGYNLFRAILPVEGDQPFIVAGSEMGLNIYEPQKNSFTKLLINDPEQSNLTDGTVTSIFLDQTKVLWVGTKKGLSKYDSYSKDFSFYTTRNFDPTESIITGISASEKNHFWIGTMGGGLFKFKPGKNDAYEKSSRFESYEVRTNQKNNFTKFIQTLYVDSRGKVWFGTAGAGVYSFNEHNIGANNEIDIYDHYYLKSKPAISDDYIMSITEGADGSMWIGTWSSGLNRISRDGKVEVYDESLLAQAPLVVLFEDSNENLWVGTRGSGIYRINEQEGGLDISKYGAAAGLGNLFVNAIYEDQEGILWIGTEDGLYFLPDGGEQIKRYNLQSEMEAEVIVGILSDVKGRLWLSHWKGLTMINPDQSPAVLRHFDRQDHIQGGFFYNNCSLKDQYGNLIFGGSNGFNIINPEEDYVNPMKPQIILQEVNINNRPYQWQEKDHDQQDLTLNYDQNSLSFEFAALHFAAPEKIKYAYKLTGFDEKWHYIESDRRFVNYTNLPAGNYQFLVNATNNDGIWSDSYTSLTFIVSPPWWRTPWALAIYAFLLMLILFVFRKIIIIRTNLINDLKLEKIERANIEHLNKAKLEFFTNISHEFRTPLTLILGPLHRVKNAVFGDLDLRQHVNAIDHNAQRLLRLVNQLLDFRKAESGNFKLEIAEGDIISFILEIKLSFDHLASQNNIDFQLQTQEEKVLVWFDRDQFEKIMYNLTYNAFKNTPPGGIIRITVNKTKEEVQIAVSNTGKGIKPEDVEHVFERFYSGSDPDNVQGSGIGLALTKSLIALHGGSIEVESEVNELTRFTFNVPLGNRHFKEEHLLPVKSNQARKHLSNVVQEEATYFLEPEKHQEKDHLQKILIVEDNQEVRAFTASIFQKSYTVLEAENGEEGLKKAQKELPEVIISDIMMPVMDGINLCKKLKQDIRTSHIPVILLTARTPLIFREQGLETGADDYVTKPFDPKLLALKVKNFIKLREAIKNTFADNAVLEIEPRKVTLTSTDEIFINKALESIERNMDNPDFTVEDLAADVCMSRMQLYRKTKALIGQSANEFIRTIRLKRAAQLLEQDQLNVAEVTYKVGFSDLKYFRSCFKKQFGVNPSTYCGSEKKLDVE